MDNSTKEIIAAPLCHCWGWTSSLLSFPSHRYLGIICLSSFDWLTNWLAINWLIDWLVVVVQENNINEFTDFTLYIACCFCKCKYTKIYSICIPLVCPILSCWPTNAVQVQQALYKEFPDRWVRALFLWIFWWCKWFFRRYSSKWSL